jgi:type II secretory pathway component PulF
MALFNNKESTEAYFKKVAEKSAIVRWLQTDPLSFHGPRWRSDRLFWRVPRELQYVGLLQLIQSTLFAKADLVPVLAAYAEEQRGFSRFRMRRFAGRVQQSSLIEALEQTPEVLPDDAVLAIRLGSQMGTLRETLSMLIETYQQKVATQTKEARGWTAYAIISGIVISLILLFINSKIIPTFYKMWEEFGIDLDSRLLMVKRFNDFIASGGGLFFFLLLLLVAAIWSGATRRLIVRFLPMLRPNQSLKITSSLLRMIAVNIEHGKPMSGMLSTLAKYHYNGKARHKLLVARNELEHGAEQWESLKGTGLLSFNQAKAMVECKDPRSRAWIMARSADEIDRTITCREGRWLALVHPLATLLVGCVVLIAGYVGFGVLGQLIQSLV